MSSTNLNSVVLKYLEFEGFATYDQLYAECNIYDWTWSSTDMDMLLDDLKQSKLIKDYCLHVDDFIAIHVYVPRTAVVKIVEVE